MRKRAAGFLQYEFDGDIQIVRVPHAKYKVLEGNGLRLSAITRRAEFRLFITLDSLQNREETIFKGEELVDEKYKFSKRVRNGEKVVQFDFAALKEASSVTVRFTRFDLLQGTCTIELEAQVSVGDWELCFGYLTVVNGTIVAERDASSLI